MLTNCASGGLTVPLVEGASTKSRFWGIFQGKETSFYFLNKLQREETDERKIWITASLTQMWQHLLCTHVYIPFLISSHTQGVNQGVVWKVTWKQLQFKITVSYLEITKYCELSCLDMDNLLQQCSSGTQAGHPLVEIYNYWDSYNLQWLAS